MPLQVDAILFDMDGTLVDESRSYREAIRRTAEFLLSQPVTMDEVDEIKRVPGLNVDWDATWALVGRRLHGHILPPSDADRGSYAYRRLRNVFQTYYLGDRVWREVSGAEPPFLWAEPLIMNESPLMRLETLARLARFKLGIVTSRPRMEALLALRQHAFNQYFGEDVVVTMDDTVLQKPHPAPLRELVRRLECHHPVYVGDTINDVMAAAAAGMPAIFVGPAPLSSPHLEREPRYHLRDVNEIVSICAELSPAGS